ncbi:FAD-dependent oxidoreductase [Humibacter sp.]|uniref:FAD-dependent oxidoreductase n=1 Tax=Humibacter sp. TaxID=1940291 RepID=UPI003F7F2A47
MREQTLETDVTVVGGGLAGVCAAIAAARLGKRVALVTNRPVLGGNSSSEIRVWVCGATAHGMQRFARETGIMGELYVENQYRNPEGNPVHWDEVVLDAVRAEPNILLFLNTDVHVVHANGPDAERSIDHVRGWTMGSELWTTFQSAFYVDATGDGLIGALAGARFRMGREAREEFGERGVRRELGPAHRGQAVPGVDHPLLYEGCRSPRRLRGSRIRQGHRHHTHPQNADHP